MPYIKHLFWKITIFSNGHPQDSVFYEGNILADGTNCHKIVALMHKVYESSVLADAGNCYLLQIVVCNIIY